MKSICNMTGQSEQWTADIVTNETFTHTIAVWTEDGVQHARVRSVDGEVIAERASEKGEPLPQSVLHEWALSVVPQ